MLKFFFIVSIYLISSECLFSQGKDSSLKTNESLDEFYRAEISTAFADSNINQFYKNILTEGRINDLQNEKPLLSLVDSLLFTSKSKHQFFYFLVFTKSINGADGYYSEAIGIAAYKFVNSRTEVFAEYFDLGVRLSDIDLKNWAKVILGEIQISREREELKAIGELETTLKNSLKSTKKTYSEIIDRLIVQLRFEALKAGFER